VVRGFSLLRRFTTRLGRPARPPVAVEIAPGGVTAAAVTDGPSGVRYAIKGLAPGSVVPSANQTNLRSTEELAAALRSTLEDVSVASSALTVLLPDLATRVFFLEFDSLPDDPRDVLALLRLRLRKVLPFEADAAKISFQTLHKEHGHCKVLVVVISGAVLSEYEAVVREAGFEPGAVLPSGLAALAALKSPNPVLSAYLNGHSLTVSISSKSDIFLHRTHELSKDAGDRHAEIQRDIAVAVAYFEDELKSSPQSIHYAGTLSAETFSQSVVNNIPVVGFLSSSEGPGTISPEATHVAALVGALAGARVA
jgi:type IV pilus assembly protein PilM